MRRRGSRLLYALKLFMNYYLKIKSLSENPWYDLINNPPPSEFFEKSKTVPPFGTHILPYIVETDFDPTSIDSQCEQNNIMFDTSLSRFKKIRRVKQFFGKNTSWWVNDTTHTLKPTQVVQSVSSKWQLLRLTLMTHALFDYETASLDLMPSYKVYT